MRSYFTLIFLSFIGLSVAQLNRYPYIQSTTQTSTIIAWKTANDAVGKVVYGLSTSSLNDTLVESTAGKRHALTLNNLQENTIYYYSIFSGSTLLASEYFTTASDSTDQDFSFIQYGDCGYNSGVQATIGALMEADDASFAVVCGDVDQGGVPHVSQSAGGDNYDDIYFNVYNNGTTSKMLSRECHYTAIGNHDVYANNGATYDLEFHLPHNNADSSERYYSFEWGDAKFIALDVITPFDPTTFPLNQKPIDQRWWTDFRQGSPQYQFLEDELKCNDKKWVFIYFHEGPWTNYWGVDYNLPNFLGGDYYQYDGNVMVRQHLVPLFEQYDVDFVLVGHSHLYEQAEKNGVMYITSGGAGDVSGNTEYANHPEILKTIIDNLYVKYEVDHNTVSYKVINDENNIIDSFSRTKNYVEYQVNTITTPVSCFGGNNGIATLNIQGPKGPYTVEWFDGSFGTSKTNLAAGTYYAYIKNAYGCEKVTEVTITEPPILVPNIISSTGNFSFCEGESLVLEADNTYASYSWSNGGNGFQTSISNAGTIQLTVTNANACVGISNSQNIVELPLPVANFGYANNGPVYNFLATDLNGDIYYWNFGDGIQESSAQNLINHEYTANGNYTVSLWLVNECDSVNIEKIVSVNHFTTGILDVYLQNAISIVPNPFQTETQISVLGLGNELKVEMFDVLGGLVYNANFNSENFTLKNESLSKGTYFLKVSNTDKRYSLAKIVIN